MIKKILFPVVFITVLSFASCSRKSAVKPQSKGIAIGGTIYDTVRVGKQTWTSVNYNGPGGVNFNNGVVNDPLYGKLYTFTEAEAISLPPGWHLPADTDFNNLLVYLGATRFAGNPLVILNADGIVKMLSTSGWANSPGTNATGLAIPGAGFFYSGSAHYGFNAQYLSAQLLSSSLDNYGNHLSLGIDEVVVFQAFVGVTIPLATDRGSVRFVKDN